MMSHTFKLSAIPFAAFLAACGGGSNSVIDAAAPAPTPAPVVVSVAPSVEPALEAAKTFLAKYDALLATAIPTPGSAATALNDGCYLANGRSKAYIVADFDADPLAVASRQAGVGTVRSNVKVLADRTVANADGTSRREIDVKYDVAFKDGSKFESPADTVPEETIISGSSAGAKLADGSACATSESKSDWRFFGNRKIVTTFVNATNQFTDRSALATGLPLAPPLLHRKFVTLGVQDPAKLATYATITGPGLISSTSLTVKLVSPRLLRDAPEFAGKNGNFVNWKDDDNFRVCRNASGGNAAAEIADCVLNGATEDRWLAPDNVNPAALDTAFAVYGFVAGGTYTINLFADDGWKTVNGQLGKTPIATYTSKLENLPFSAAALAPAGSQSLYPSVLTGSKTNAEVGTAILVKSPYSLNLTWSAPGAMPDGRKVAHTNVYFYEQGRASAGTTFNPASRQISIEYPGPTATALNATVPAAAAQLVTPTYAEIGIQYTNRNGNSVRAVYAWQ